LPSWDASHVAAFQVLVANQKADPEARWCPVAAVAAAGIGTPASVSVY
jgi:hypothetical protein